ncbi:two-component regulator propeller domain-containing protein [Undibacterium flavidum]|uniref:histidine kinase n=1 Tax=Undibacterium flavidum TaxID=2762297 RepID=A0ABR6YE48_9BURK|nr:two-component regulator propeller domain-containing protein [Undibacterium flavidum]MBC3874836.1 GAF domain-containing protein [Undibacterium flavidum]
MHTKSCFLPIFAIYRLLCAALLISFFSSANIYASSKQTLRFTHISQEQGLNDGSIPAIFQDKYGLMWLGTSTGLVRYDGRHVRQWSSDTEDPNSLSSPLVSAILAGQQDSLWIATSGGLNRLNMKTEQIERVQMPDNLSLQQKRIWALAPQLGDKIWVATQSQLYLFNPLAETAQRFVAFPLEGDTGALIRAMISDTEGGVWVAVGSRVYHLNANGKTLQQFDAASLHPEQQRLDFSIRSMSLDADNRLWLGMQTGVQIWNISTTPAKPDAIMGRLRLPQARVYATFLDEEKSIWIGFGGGESLYRIRLKQNEKVETYRNYPALSSSIVSSSVASLFQDRTGTLWIGTWGYGISLVDLRSQSFTNYFHIAEEKNSLSTNNVVGIHLDQTNHAWVASYGGALNYLDLNTGIAQHFPQEITGALHTKALRLQSEDKLWLGGDDGLFLFNPVNKKTQKIALAQDTPGANSISAIIVDRRGDVWASSGNGLYQISPDLKVTTHKAAPQKPGSLSHDTIDCLLEDTEGRIWIGSKGGLQMWDHTSAQFSQPISANQHLKNPASLAIYGLHQDQQGRIWVGTATGLYQLVKHQAQWELESWKKARQMPAGWVITIQDDNEGNLWLGAEQGLVQLNIATESARTYHNLNGPLNGSFSFGATTKAADGSLFFGAWGLIAFNPKQLRDNNTPVKIVLSDLLEFNRSLSADRNTASDHLERDINKNNANSSTSNQRSSTLQELGVTGPLYEAKAIHLTPKQSMISFEFSALQFYDYKQNRYAWKLEGFDQDWIYGKPGEAVATYTNLDQGDYVLKVKAASSTGDWSSEMLTLDVKVSPPFWKSRWFLVLMLLGALSLLVLFYRLRVGFLQRTRDQLELQVSLRTVEVREQKNQLRKEKEIAEQEREIAEKARRDIIVLSEIGREISASLDIEAIQQVFYAQVAKLMDADVYGIGMVDWNERIVNFDNVMDRGTPTQRYFRSLDASNQPAARCILNAEELIIDQFDYDNTMVQMNHQGTTRGMRQDGSDVTRTNSGIYVPMLIDEQVIGVITVLSARPGAYNSTHLDMLRTLGAYAAVALDKARAYARLKLTQTKLVEQEKLAALGAIVAGVAHELNTPIGNSLLVASTLKERNDEFVAVIQSGSIRRSEIERFCVSSSEAVDLILRNLDASAQLVSSFKQISTDQTSNQRREFNLAKICKELALTMTARVKREGHEISIDIPDDITMDSFPGALGQVLSNLILNAVVHGFDSVKAGHILISATINNRNRVIISCKDDGKGIPEKNISRIFEPFFTTKLGQGGSGLGLHISYNIVNSILGGSISVQSEDGKESCFTLDLPLTAPQNQE